MPFAKLILRNLTRRPLRSLLTVGSLVVALFLLCTLRSIVTTLESGIKNLRSKRLVMQSAVSLFVDLPLAYQEKVEAVEGVARTCKWQWFGGYFQDPKNFFGQFAVDPKAMMDMYPEVYLTEGSVEDFYADRRGCIVGRGLMDRFAEKGWEIGKPIPIIGALFPHPGGANQAWEFTLRGVYDVKGPNLDRGTLFFQWDYFEETLKDSPEGGGERFGVLFVETEPEVPQIEVMNAIDALFENSPQRVQTTSEAEFRAQFVSMMGSVPFFVSAIGSGVLFAIFLACVNTMLMAGREQIHDVGILKALGFTDARVFGLLITQSLLLCTLGGVGGVGLALLLQGKIAGAIGALFPGFSVAESTVRLGLGLTLGIGLLAGIAPAWNASRLRCVEALGTGA